MKVVFEGAPKEIAALVLAVQERRNGGVIRIGSAGKRTEADRAEMVEAIRQCLGPNTGEHPQMQSLDSKEHKPHPSGAPGQPGRAP